MFAICVMRVDPGFPIKGIILHQGWYIIKKLKEILAEYFLRIK